MLHQMIECPIQNTHWWVSYLSAEMQLAYSRAPVNGAAEISITDSSKIVPAQ